MSYDVYLTADVGGPEPVALALLDRNYTYNVSPMIRDAAGVGLGDLSGKPAREVHRILTIAVVKMAQDPAKYRAMNPPNGWGDYEGCLEFLAAIVEACRQAPDAKLLVT